MLPTIPPIKRNPVFLYYEDNFKKPTPFKPDIVVDIGPVWEKKVDGMDAHESQFYEFQTNVNASVAATFNSRITDNLMRVGVNYKFDPLDAFWASY